MTIHCPMRRCLAIIGVLGQFLAVTLALWMLPRREQYITCECCMGDGCEACGWRGYWEVKR